MYQEGKPRLDEKTLRKTEKRIREQPNIVMYEMIEEYHLPVSAPALCKTIIRKPGLRRKKKMAYASEQHSRTSDCMR